MISSKVIGLLLLIALLSKETYSQFVNIELTIEPELTASVEQNLDFGTIITGTGINQIGLGDFNMGIFSIRAINTQSVYVSMTHPKSLLNSSIQSSDEIPIELDFAYNTIDNDPDKSSLLNNDMGYIDTFATSNETWHTIYLYVFGYINVGQVSNGMYEGDIFLNVEYY